MNYSISLMVLEEKTEQLKTLFGLRPIPKKAWKLLEELTQASSQTPRRFVSYAEEWIESLPRKITPEAVAGLSPDVWIYLHQEWVSKPGVRWIEIPKEVQDILSMAKDWSLSWMNPNKDVDSDRHFPEYGYGIWIPTVESLKGDDSYFGRLRFLQVRNLKNVAAGKGRIVMEREKGNSAEDDEIMHFLCKACFNWLEQFTSESREPDALLRFADRSGIHSGQSIGLGAFGVAASQMLKKLELAKRYSLKGERLAATGVLSDGGWIQNVDEVSLRNKVELCFYS